MKQSNNNILELKNLNFSYKKNPEFSLKNINITYSRKKIYAILGANGSGKSTLLSCLNNFNSNYTGEIILNTKTGSVNIKELPISQISKYISKVDQQPNKSSLNVFDTVMLGRNPYINISPSLTDYEITSKAIDTLNINHLSLKSCRELSGGEYQAVCIARALAQNTDIILMDEPTNNLDIKKQHEYFKLLKNQVIDKKLCVICVLHDINFAAKYADELIFIKNGEVLASGTTEIISKTLIDKVYGIDSKIIDIDKQKYVVI